MKNHWITRPKTIKKLCVLMGIILFLSVFVQFLFPIHGHFEIEESFAFAAWFGFVSCILMVVVAKLLGFVIKRSDNYYKKNQD